MDLVERGNPTKGGRVDLEKWGMTPLTNYALYSGMLGKGLQCKTTALFEKRIKNTPVDHPEKCGVFSHCQYDFRSS